MLTDDMRDFLREQPSTALMWDLTQELRERFKLTPEEVGEVLTEWVRETV